MWQGVGAAPVQGKMGMNILGDFRGGKVFSLKRSKQNPAWLSLPCIKKINGKRQRERVMWLIMDEGGGCRAMIILLIKEQNGFYLSKELWGLWVAKGVLTSDVVWILIY